MKTSELTGAALDWAVAKCEGLPMILDPMGFRRGSPGSPQAGWWVWFGTPSSMIVGHVQKSNRDGQGYSPSANWAQGGPIIEREGICVSKRYAPRFLPKNTPAVIDWVSQYFESPHTALELHRQFGPTALIAAMRCYVASKLGGEVEIPAELQ